MEKFLSYDHCIIWGKQASYKMLEKPQHSEIVKTTRQHKGPSTENTICLSVQHEMSEVIMIPIYSHPSRLRCKFLERKSLGMDLVL